MSYIIIELWKGKTFIFLTFCILQQSGTIIILSEMPQILRRTLKMTITDIKIRKIIPEGRLRAVISITIDDQIAIHDIKVVQGDARLFVAMPSRKDENGVFRDIVHPISPDARQSIEGQILDAYTRHIEMMQAEAEAEQAGLI